MVSRPRVPWFWWVIVLLAALISAYAFAYVALGERMYQAELKDSFKARPWGIYPHALFGGLSLLLGAPQLHRGLLVKRRNLHRTLGKAYVVCSLVTGTAGLYMAFFAASGSIARAGFGLLALVLLTCTLQGYQAIRGRRIELHREWMLRSYAMIFAAVTLRLWLPLLLMAFGSFPPAYQTVAWLAWVPNLAFAEAYIRRTRAAFSIKEVL
jgi:uncharacterized membrane protein